MPDRIDILVPIDLLRLYNQVFIGQAGNCGDVLIHKPPAKSSGLPCPLCGFAVY
jgi:hypothetical protein